MDKDEEASKKRRSNSIRGSNKKKKLAILNNAKQNEAKCPNVIGFESDSSNSSDTVNKNEDKTHVPDKVSGSWVVTNNENNSTKVGGVETTSERSQELKNSNENNFTKSEENKASPNKSQKCKKPTEEVQQSTTPKDRTPAVFVPLNRKPEIKAARLNT